MTPAITSITKCPTAATEYVFKQSSLFTQQALWNLSLSPGVKICWSQYCIINSLDEESNVDEV